MTNQAQLLCREYGSSPYIETVSGRKFHFLDPQPDEIDIEDIAHALAMQCRYTGHTQKFYSVAEHCVLVSELANPEHRLCALLHDASEAYLTDVASPVKRFLSNYRDMERVIMEAIAKKFGFEWPEPRDVRAADKLALLVEARQLLPSGGREWDELKDYRLCETDIKLDCFPPALAKRAFLDVFHEVVRG